MTIETLFISTALHRGFLCQRSIHQLLFQLDFVNYQNISEYCTNSLKSVFYKMFYYSVYLPWAKILGSKVRNITTLYMQTQFELHSQKILNFSMKEYVS